MSSATSSAASGKPTVVLVHGAWADASSWTGVVELLHGAGYTARAVPNSIYDAARDGETVADFVRTIEGPVVLVGHSYGGQVITIASAQVENVTALVYVDAVTPDVGEGNISLIGATSDLNAAPETLYDTVPYPGAPEGDALSYLKKDVFLTSFASDVPTAQAEVLWAEQRAAAGPAFTTAPTAVGWKTIPSWSFISTGDRIIKQDAKEEMAERAGSTVTIFDGGSHLSLITQPAAVFAVIEAAAGKVS